LDPNVNGLLKEMRSQSEAIHPKHGRIDRWTFEQKGAGGNTGKHRMSGKGRIENLKPPWKPGESGNLGGRPRKRPISDRYAAFAEMPLSEKRCRELGLAPGSTLADGATKTLFEMAMDGKPWAAREIREGIEGRTAERPEISDPGIVTIHVVYDKAPKKPRVDAPGDTSPPTSPEDA
jgi:hypothetical protein